jgi:CRP-like cAMP-binding protein
MDIAALMQRSRWFARQDAALRTAIVAQGRVVALDRGQWVYGEGDFETGICAVLEGALRLEVSIDADRDVLLGMVGPGSVLGQTHGHGGGPRIVTARAARASHVLLLSDASLERIAAGQPTIWRAVSELVYEQLDVAVRLAAHLLASGPRARICARLLLLAGDGRAVAVNQADLAEMCGLTRKTVNGHLRALERIGLLRLGYGEIALLDEGRLRTLAHSGVQMR